MNGPNETSNPVEVTSEELAKAVKQATGMSKAKILKMMRREEITRRYKVYPPGSHWKRRDGSYAYAGPPYGGRMLAKHTHDEGEE